MDVALNSKASLLATTQLVLEVPFSWPAATSFVHVTGMMLRFRAGILWWDKATINSHLIHVNLVGHTADLPTVKFGPKYCSTAYETWNIFKQKGISSPPNTTSLFFASPLPQRFSLPTPKSLSALVSDMRFCESGPWGPGARLLIAALYQHEGRGCGLQPSSGCQQTGVL